MRLAIRGESDSVHLWRNPSVFVRVELPFRIDRERDGFMYFLYSRPRFRFSIWVERTWGKCVAIYNNVLYLSFQDSECVYLGHQRTQLNGRIIRFYWLSIYPIFLINSEYQERYKQRNISILVTISGMLVVNEFWKAWLLNRKLFTQTTNMEAVGFAGCIWFICRSNSFFKVDNLIMMLGKKFHCSFLWSSPPNQGLVWWCSNSSPHHSALIPSCWERVTQYGSCLDLEQKADST